MSNKTTKKNTAIEETAAVEQVEMTAAISEGIPAEETLEEEVNAIEEGAEFVPDDKEEAKEEEVKEEAVFENEEPATEEAEPVFEIAEPEPAVEEAKEEKKEKVSEIGKMISNLYSTDGY